MLPLLLPLLLLLLLETGSWVRHNDDVIVNGIAARATTTMSLCQPEPEQQQCQSRAAVTELSIKCGYINNPTEKSIHVCPSHLIVWVESSDNKPVHTFITRWWKGLCNGRKHKIKCMPQQQHAAAAAAAATATSSSSSSDAAKNMQRF